MSHAVAEDVDQAGAGEMLDESAFRVLYQRTAPSLRAFILRQVGDAELASDLAQDAFVRLLRARPAAISEAQTKGYLYRTASSLVADHWRRIRREERWSSWHSRDDHTAPHEPSDLDRVFRDLKARERYLLWLAYVEGMDHREIAEALGVSRMSVKVLLFRARKRLAAALVKHGLEPEATR